MEQLTKLQIIEETIEYYKTHERSIAKNGVDCLYNGPNNTKCAFSRCCTDGSDFIESGGSGSQSIAVLLPQYSHIPYDDIFWKDLQNVHDYDTHWNSFELNQEGIIYAKRLKEIYS